MFVDVENIGIHYCWDRTNVPCQIAKQPVDVVSDLLEAQLEFEMKVARQAEIEFRALYDYAKYEEQQKLREVKLVEDVEVQKPSEDSYKIRCEIERAENMNVIIPRVIRLLINQKPGIALKRFIKRELEEDHPMITKETTHVLRVESLQNGRRFNAIIDFEPINYFPSGSVEKNHWPYEMVVDRKVPWSILNHSIDGRTWLDFKDRLKKNYKIVEIYGL